MIQFKYKTSNFIWDVYKINALSWAWPAISISTEILKTDSLWYVADSQINGFINSPLLWIPFCFMLQ